MFVMHVVGNTQVDRFARGAARFARSRIPVRFGSLRRLSPVSRTFGYDRGQPIDRYYIERFLGDNAHLTRGRGLEIGDSTYSRRFGGSGPGGHAADHVPGLGALSSDRWAESWYWALTPMSAVRLFGDVFGPDNVEVTAHGNVLTSVGFLEGRAARELRREELDVHDPQLPMLITVKACKPG